MNSNTPIRIPAFLVSIFILIQICSSAFPIAKPGCRDRCGNVSIPYPFGMDMDCVMDGEFFIECNNVTNKPTISSTEIRSISLQGQMSISYKVSHECYDPATNLRTDYFSPGNYFTNVMVLNRTANKFTAIGCDTYAWIETSSAQRLYTSTGCMSVCGSKEDIVNGSCSGVGCCQTPVASNRPSMLNTTLNSFYNHSRVSGFNPCSYAFVVEESAFRFSADQLTGISKDSSFPVVVDWVGAFNLSCGLLQGSNMTYACRDVANSECYDQVGATGYRCRCKDGFEGNPYLSDYGCQDIDECASNSTHNCGIYSTCVNTVGSYRCSCNPGYSSKTIILGRNGTSDIFCQPPDKKNYWPIIAGVASVAGVLFFVAAILTFFRLIKKWQKRKQNEKFFKRNGGLLLKGQLSSNDKLVHKTKIFSAKELSKASDGFNPNRVLGEGGQGTVYKGMLTDGTIVAIKKSKRVDEDQLQQFINEVVILSQVIHKNVVNLLGCCLETEVPLLVYEFVPNGTLYSLIHHGDDEVEPLTWSTRLRIAREVASALAYLHSSISTPIFHKDIKSLNILMDEKFRAKVSDFGTSRSVELDKTHLTTRVQGTFGYIDPEFFQSNQFTDKSDVYSFGVVLIELLTRQKPISAKKGEDDSDLSLVRRFLESMEKDCLKMVLDPEIIEDRTEEEVVTVAGLAARCLHLNGRRRPSMKELVTELENIKKSKLDSELQPRYSPSLIYYEEDYSDMSTFTSTFTGGSTQSESYTSPLLYDTV